jgi:hypothetical protein
MTYRMACSEPDFCQSVPPGNWTLVPDALFPGSYRYRNNDTAETVLVPAIWYTGTAKSRAGYLAFCAERSEESAARLAREGKAWSASEAASMRRQASRLRFQASLYEACGNAIAGHVSTEIDAAIALLTGFARGYSEAA